MRVMLLIASCYRRCNETGVKPSSVNPLNLTRTLLTFFICVTFGHGSDKNTVRQEAILKWAPA